MTSLLGVYHQLPPSARGVAAAARGYYLRAWRYGRDTDGLVDAALERESWTADQWRRWREERLALVLHRAATRVPHYRDQWARRRARGDRAATDVLASWPVLEKEALRRNPRDFVADDRRPGAMFHEHTSGTTGTPLDLWWSRATVRHWYALFEARWRRWYGVSRHDRWAIVGGQLVTPAAQRSPPFWVWNPALHQLYLSAHHLAPDLAHHYLAAMRRYRVRYLFGYTSALHSLAQALGEGCGSGLGLAVVLTNAEPVLEHQRMAIEAAFGCAVRETYGMAEIVTAASACDANRLHLWPEAGAVETVSAGGDETLAAGDVGDLVCTGLLNADMPLVRYRVGDRGAVDRDASPCSCGRGLPRLSALEGRSDDVLYTRDGRSVGRMDPVFKSGRSIREAQIIQESLVRVRVRLVPGAGYSPADGAAVADRIRQRLGDIRVEVEVVDAIPRNRAGKMRAVICALSAEDRAQLQRQVAG